MWYFQGLGNKSFLTPLTKFHPLRGRGGRAAGDTVGSGGDCAPLGLPCSTHPAHLSGHQHAEAVEPVVIGLQAVGLGHVASALQGHGRSEGAQGPCLWVLLHPTPRTKEPGEETQSREGWGWAAGQAPRGSLQALHGSAWRPLGTQPPAQHTSPCMAVVHPWSRCQETRPTRVSCEPHLQSALSPHPVLVPGVRVADNLHQVLGVDAADSLLGATGRQHRKGDHLPSSGQPHPQGTECVQSSSQDLPAWVGTTAMALPQSAQWTGPPEVPQGSGRPPWEQGDRTVCRSLRVTAATGRVPAQPRAQAGLGDQSQWEELCPWKPLP